MSESKVNPELLKDLIGRPIAMYHKDHLKQLVIVLCQILGLADEKGILTLGIDDKQPEQEQK